MARSLEQQLAKYFEENCFCVAVNREISISTSTPSDPEPVEITVCGTLSTKKGIHDLEIFSTCNSYKSLVETFKLGSVDDLQQITVDMLKQLYFEERGGILCSVVNDRHTLIFRKNGNSTIVADERDIAVEVIEAVYETNESFIVHTMACA